MLIKAEKEDIIEGFTKAASILPSKTGAAYLRSIWIRAQGNTIGIFATDASIEFCGLYKAHVEEEGLAGVQGRALVDLLKRLPAGAITFRTDDKTGSLAIEQGRRKYRLPAHDASWFKDFSDFPEDGALAWSGREFGELIDKVAFCISDEDAMEAISCLSMKPVADGALEVCGLNGHQFAMQTIRNEGLCELAPAHGILIQRKYLSEIKRWLPADGIDLNLVEKRLYLRRVDRTEIFSLPLSFYQYPDYNSFLAKVRQDDVSRIETNRLDLMDSLERVAIFNTELNRGALFELDGHGEMTLSCMGQDIGSATETLEVESSGDVDRISFPTKSMIEILGHFQSERIGMRLTGVEGPAAIVGEKDENYVVIIMPMKMVTDTYYKEEDA